MKKGFTLVELLVVLVIIGIIIGLILPNTLRAINEANERECASNIRAVDTAIQLCYTQTRNWQDCNTIAQLTAVPASGNPYLDSAPTDPFGGSFGYNIVGDDTNGFQVDKSEHFPTWPPRNVDHL